mgnify:CR=1 FL=1|tara:strand:+ start:488 stop:1348 length:861 start_codon:yes stop_codon:yes gene_type:complete
MAKKKTITLEPDIENLPFTEDLQEDIVLISPRKITTEDILEEEQKTGLPFYTDENTSFIIEQKSDTQFISPTDEIRLNKKTKPTPEVPELYTLSSGSSAEIISPLEQNMGKYYKLKQLISYDYKHPLYYELNNYPGIDKEYDGEEIAQNLRDLMENCVDRIIEEYPHLVLISAYRSLKLNRMIGGSHDNSSHIKGCAIDFKVPEEHTSYVFNWCIKNLPEWHELMWAYPERGNRSWIHLSYKKGRNMKSTTLASERENIHDNYGGERRGMKKEYQEGIEFANQNLV